MIPTNQIKTYKECLYSFPTWRISCESVPYLAFQGLFCNQLCILEPLTTSMVKFVY
uniref:Uncharacterized protein n=1 Tax=Rhizophora mucronata TaxID=61149 RepID=A0A2P2PBF4_RHIMU